MSFNFSTVEALPEMPVLPVGVEVDELNDSEDEAYLEDDYSDDENEDYPGTCCRLVLSSITGRSLRR